MQPLGPRQPHAARRAPAGGCTATGLGALWGQRGWQRPAGEGACKRPCPAGLIRQSLAPIGEAARGSQRQLLPPGPEPARTPAPRAPSFGQAGSARAGRAEARVGGSQQGLRTEPGAVSRATGAHPWGGPGRKILQPPPGRPCAGAPRRFVALRVLQGPPFRAVRRAPGPSLDLD